MRTRIWTLVATLLMAGLLAGPAALPSRAADPASECMAGGDIYVYVIDRGTEVIEGCTRAQTGMGRLLELTTVQTAGQGFVCQIAARPDRCVGNPAGDEPYWVYWWWRDGQWQYATIGASYRGVPGSIEAWHFSPGELPPITPDAGQPASPETTAPAGQTGSVAPSIEQQPADGSPTGQDGTAPTQPVAADTRGTTGWLPSAITVGAVAAAVIGYGWWRRRGNRG